MLTSNIIISILCILLVLVCINSQTTIPSFSPPQNRNFSKSTQSTLVEQNPITITYYNGGQKPDYTDPNSLNENDEQCSILTYCDFLAKCQPEQNPCEFCETLDDPLSKIVFVNNKTESNCNEKVAGFLDEMGKIIEIRQIRFDGDLKMLTYANSTSIMGVVNKNSNNYLVSYPKNYDDIQIKEESVVAGYDGKNNEWYYILGNRLIIKNYDKNDIGVPIFPPPFQNPKILSADIDFHDQNGLKIYIGVANNNNIDIYKTDISSSQNPGPHPYLIQSIPFTNNNSFDSTILKIQNGILLYISSGQYIIQLNTKNKEYMSCNVNCKVKSLALNIDKLYFSCIDSKNISRMFPFCIAHPYSDNVFPNAPLIVQLGNDFETPNETKKPDLPDWFPYVVAGGAALILLFLIIIIACICYKFKMAKRNAAAPPLPPGFTGLSYNNKEVDDNLYTDLETFESTPKTKKKAAPTLPAIRTDSVYADLIAAATATDLGNKISEPDYDNVENTEKEKIDKK